MRQSRILAGCLVLFVGHCAVVTARDWSASLDWAQRADLGTPISGVVDEVLVEPGDVVAAGQVLVRLDDRVLKARVRRAEARLAELAAVRAEAERERDRAQELYDRTLLSDRDLQLARIAFTEADARYAAGQAELIEAQVELDYSAVRSPFDAWVLNRPVHAGQVIASRLDPPVLVVLAARDAMLARFVVAPEDLAKLAPGQVVEVHSGESHVDGTVVFVGREPGEGGPPVRYPVAVRFKPPEGSNLRAGQKVHVRLP